jgi:hypothetical protein
MGLLCVDVQQRSAGGNMYFMLIGSDPKGRVQRQ